MESWDLLQHIWYVLIGILLAGYSVLDGFDLGIGCLFPILARDEKDKRILSNAISPFWDGNEVWLVTGGAALFAAFPLAYATVFSGFYLAFMIVLFALIFRAVSIEFMAHDTKHSKLWGWAFVLGSAIPSLLFGVALGNLILGIDLTPRMVFTGNILTLLRPFPLSIGLLGLVAILMQGATYTVLKTEGPLRDRARMAVKKIWVLFILFFSLSFIATAIYNYHVLSRPLGWIGCIVVLLGWTAMKSAHQRGRDKVAFYLSSICFLGLWVIVGAVHYPNLVRASNDPALSLTMYNASSSRLTLTIMTIIALIGMPIVIASTVYVYHIFKQKAAPERDGYW